VSENSLTLVMFPPLDGGDVFTTAHAKEGNRDTEITLISALT